MYGFLELLVQDVWGLRENVLAVREMLIGEGVLA
ncbi:hypothetical protein Desmer_2792 [Desulfosporosinus meridiei DSM 13257]|uniref:Uncharacterized protein n=1 Tax=Desulfosporosinus meridiei (strain ATCC BAA-275 / DSM 13257 / KCTC 12902 / NCIMB 13706 / S10) TaxID=768704 RepID=J7IX12_DESMD|nr:hypothetical protein Desmer_2792 [Desulfosporosinus meridiei DSM 13257]